MLFRSAGRVGSTRAGAATQLLAQRAGAALAASPARCCLSTAAPASQQGGGDKTTYFGFQTVREEEKADMVGSVFRRVAEK